MLINREDYVIGKYFYKNYVSLNDAESTLILRWRNNPEINRWMVSQDKISIESHMRFIHSLKNRDDAYYWMVFKNNHPFGTFNVSHLNHCNNSVETGYYLNPDYLNSGEGLEFHYNYKTLLYNILDVETINGSVLYGNSRALQLSMFYGAEIVGTEVKQGKRYIKLVTEKEKFNSLSYKSLVRAFVQYCKSNPVNWNNLMLSYE